MDRLPVSKNEDRPVGTGNGPFCLIQSGVDPIRQQHTAIKALDGRRYEYALSLHLCDQIPRYNLLIIEHLSETENSEDCSLIDFYTRLLTKKWVERHSDWYGEDTEVISTGIRLVMERYITDLRRELAERYSRMNDAYNTYDWASVESVICRIPTKTHNDPNGMIQLKTILSYDDENLMNRIISLMFRSLNTYCTKNNLPLIELKNADPNYFTGFVRMSIWIETPMTYMLNKRFLDTHIPIIVSRLVNQINSYEP